MKHLERDLSVTPIFPEQTKGARGHLMKTYGYAVSKGPIAVAIKDIHGPEAQTEADRLKKTVARGSSISYDNFGIGDDFAYQNPEPMSPVGMDKYISARGGHSHPERVNLPPLDE